MATAVKVCVAPVMRVALNGETAMLVKMSDGGFTVSAAVCLVPAAVVAVIVTNVGTETAVVVTGNVAVPVRPATTPGEVALEVPPLVTLTLTEAGTLTAGLLLLRETTTLLPGCILRTVTLPVLGLPPTRLAGSTATDERPEEGTRNKKEIGAVSVTLL